MRFEAGSLLQQTRFYNRLRAYGKAYEQNLSQDERLLALPHHRRIALGGAVGLEVAFLEEFAPDVVAEAKREHSTRQDIAETMLRAYPHLAAEVYKGRFDVLCDVGLRLMNHFGRIRHFQTTDSLEEMLQSTDFGDDIPAAWFRTPFDNVFIEFGEHRRSPLTILDPNSGVHVVEGAYLLSGLSAPIGGGDTLVRGFDLVIFGSPIGKRNTMDDAFIHMGFPIEDESQPITELVSRVVENYSVRREFENAPAFRPVVEHLAKVLVYLGMRDARQRVVVEGSDSERRIRGLKSPAKQEKARRQAARLYDRVVVGPTNPLEGSGSGTGGLGGTVRQHVRRGHLRMQAHGPKHSLRRPVWIHPSLVGAGYGDNGVRHPEYSIR